MAAGDLRTTALAFDAPRPAPPRRAGHAARARQELRRQRACCATSICMFPQASSSRSSAAAAAARARCCVCSPGSTRPTRRASASALAGSGGAGDRARDVPGAAAAALGARARQRRGRTRTPRGGALQARARALEALRSGGPRRPRRRLAVCAVGRPEAARRARPRARQPAAPPRARRAARRARRADAHRDAGTARAGLAARAVSRRCWSRTTSARRSRSPTVSCSSKGRDRDRRSKSNLPRPRHRGDPAFGELEEHDPGAAAGRGALKLHRALRSPSPCGEDKGRGVATS